MHSRKRKQMTWLKLDIVFFFFYFCGKDLTLEKYFNCSEKCQGHAV